MTLEEQIEIVESNIAEYGVCDITIEEYKYLKQQIRADAIEEMIKLVDDDLTYDIGMDLLVNRDLLCERLEELKEQK